MKSERVIAIDVFRGLTIAMMILVNTPGSWSNVYPPLLHASWHGCTPTDLVFPFFLFAVGASMYYSMQRRKNSSDMLLKILKRTVLIFLIGLLLNAFPFFSTNPFRWFELDTWRIFGVLQRIALAYAIAALLCFKLSIRQLIYTIMILLVTYWAVLYFFGGQDPYAVTTNVIRTVDLWLLGADHLYKGFGVPFDPEGMLGAIGSAISVLIGFVSVYYFNQMKLERATRVFAISALLMIATAWFWSQWLPLNKPLWTSSYVLYSCGFSLLTLSVLLYVIDVRGWRVWSLPFQSFGQNPLAIYVLSIMLVKLYFRIHIEDRNFYSWLYEEVFKGIIDPKFGSLLFALLHVFIFWMVAQVLSRKNIIIKI